LAVTATDGTDAGCAVNAGSPRVGADNPTTGRPATPRLDTGNDAVPGVGLVNSEGFDGLPPGALNVFGANVNTGRLCAPPELRTPPLRASPADPDADDGGDGGATVVDADEVDSNTDEVLTLGERAAVDADTSAAGDAASDDDAGEDDGESPDGESDGSAAAVPATAIPTPKATAKAPTRPTCRAQPIVATSPHRSEINECAAIIDRFGCRSMSSGLLEF
jgi:hypothetical protein